MFIVTVPTPIDDYKRPDLTPLEARQRERRQVLKKGDVVMYESTVYPGCTEEICVPILERVSGLKFNQDFFAGYSPERINPGDKEHRLHDDQEVTSGSTPEVADFVDELYRTIVTAGTHKASSIRVAEAAKVIENTQRDVNIALINELALIFNRLGIDTEEVLEAAGSKWNFLPFRPGLVGGHCIGVDPYYLTHKAQEIGYHPEMILAGRRLNDSMANYVAQRGREAHDEQAHPRQGLAHARAGPHLQGKLPGPPQLQGRRRGARAEELRREVDVYDPWVDAEEAVSRVRFQARFVNRRNGTYDAVVLAVAHGSFAKWANRIRTCRPKSRTCSTTSSMCSRQQKWTEGYRQKMYQEAATDGPDCRSETTALLHGAKAAARSRCSRSLRMSTLNSLPTSATSSCSRLVRSIKFSSNPT